MVETVTLDCRPCLRSARRLSSDRPYLCAAQLEEVKIRCAWGIDECILNCSILQKWSLDGVVLHGSIVLFGILDLPGVFSLILKETRGVVLLVEIFENGRY